MNCSSKRGQSHKIKLNEVGDSIIEVLIALAVISLVLVGAYVVTSNSQRAVRDSQEHAEASKLLQGQIELVKGLTQSKTVNVFNNANLFCLLDDGTGTATSTVTTLPDLSVDKFTTATYANGCRNVGPGNLYNLSIKYDNTSHNFYLTARWDKLGGGKNQVDLTYRAYTSS